MRHLQSKPERAAQNWRSIRLSGPFLLASFAGGAYLAFRRGDVKIAWVTVAVAMLQIGLMLGTFVNYRRTRAERQPQPVAQP